MNESNHLDEFLASFENAAVIASGIAPEQLALRTPCPGYDVASLIDHLVEAARRAVALGQGHAPPPGDESPHVTLSDAPAVLRDAKDEAARAWRDDSRLASSLTMPWGDEYSGAAVVDMYLAELAVHAWDVAIATGQLDRLDPALAAPALSGARSMITPESRDLVSPGSPFGMEIPAPLDADGWERLAAFAGRDPRDIPER